ncbi:MAG: cache domain-containing protein [Bacteroidales bacterium]
MMKETSAKGKRKLFLLKIDLPALLAVILFAGMIFLYLIPGFEKVMMDRKRNLIHEMTASAYSLLEHYHSLEKGGSLEGPEAREQARAAINSIRYGDDLKDYFWITDRQPVMIAHPYRPDLNGQDLTDFHDSGGKAIFVEFVKAVDDNGDSYVDYMWQWNDDSTRIVPKLSYVRLFEPWGWVIGTGIYIEDVKTEIRSMEIRALAISGVFGLVIFSLLFAISRQSHKIEQKKSRAEEELHRSRELYRTLAEAASEGVIIWSDQGLQANKTLLSWIGFTGEEILNRPISEIISSQVITDTDSPGKLYDELTSRQYVECMLKTSTGKQVSCHADLSRITFGDRQAVLIVVRPSHSLSSASGLQLPASLLDSTATGFFRINSGKKPKFIQATAPALNIIGYSDLKELHQQNPDALFADPHQYEQIRQALGNGRNITNKEVLLRRKNGTGVWTLVNIIITDNGTDEKWYDGSIEYLSASSSGSGIPFSGNDAFGASYITGAPVSAIMKPPLTCPENTSLTRAISLMKEAKSRIIIVLNSSGDAMGVADAGSIGSAIAEGVASTSEIFRFMQAPPLFIREDAKVAAAMEKIRNSITGCLLVVTADGKLTGMITNEELAYASSIAPGLIMNDIAGAGSAISLKKIYHDSHKATLAMVPGHTDPHTLLLHISSIADAICAKVIDLCIEAEGKPPCRFAFIQTGSAGRSEQSFLTDQDNAIIFENLEGERLKKAYEYFLSLGKRINDMLDTVGFHLCKGNNMASNPKWCQPIDRWKNYFSDWIRMPGPSEILDVSIFFDFRFCYGDAALSHELREYVKSSLQTSDIFFYHMSMALKQFNPSPSVLTEETTDIKRLLMPLTGVIRLYALNHGLEGLSTIDRILELHAGKHISPELLRDALRAWKDLAYIRLSHQALCINNGREPDNRVDFRVRYADMQFLAARAIDDINNLVLMAGNDFHSVTI